MSKEFYQLHNSHLKNNVSSEITEFIQTTNLQQNFTSVIKMKSDEPSLEACRDWHHDLNAALRTFKYLVSKEAKATDPNSPRATEKIRQLEKHLSNIESLKTTLFDRIFPTDFT